MIVDRAAFSAAARMLEGHQIDHAGAVALLRWLGLSKTTGEQPERAADARLLAAAATFNAFFHIASPTAPGLIILGAEVVPDQLAECDRFPSIGVSGVGVTPLDAFRGCVGEGLEAICAVATPADIARQQPAPKALPNAMREWLGWLWPGVAPSACGGWLPLNRMRDGTTVELPTDLLLRRAPDRRVAAMPWSLNAGCGAGPTFEHASLHALFELVERDAVALWWRGGRRPRAVPPDSEAGIAAAAFLAQLRQDNPAGRHSFLLDITSDIGVPTVAAVSFGADGRGFCCGTAARATLAAAARGALLELCQMEAARELVRMKREARGDAALNAIDASHLQRYQGIHAELCGLLHPETAPSLAVELSAESRGVTPRQLLEPLAAAGFDPLVLDLSRARYGTNLCRVVCPGLEIEPSALVGPRLAAAIAETGGGVMHTGGIALM
jgi:ribosomal protein S12 methylthiotransferase accessory factor